MLVWSAHDLATGDLLADRLPVSLGGPLSEWIAKGASVQASVPAVADELPPGWQAWTHPGNAVAWCARHADGDPKHIVWAGIVRHRATGYDGDFPTITVALLPLHSLLDGWRCDEVGVHHTGTFPQIVKSLATPVLEQVRGTVQIVSDARGWHERNYDAAKPVGEALRDLVDVIDGPEWVLVPRLDDTGRLCIDMLVGDQIGGTPADSGPPVIRDVSWTREEDCTPGRWATRVVGTRGSGDESVTVAADASRTGMHETMTFSPDTGSVDTDGALAVAVREKASQVSAGVDTRTLSAPLDRLRLGIDVRLGDRVAWECAHPDMPELAEWVVGRMVGWTITTDEHGAPARITPTLEQVQVVPMPQREQPDTRFSSTRIQDMGALDDYTTPIG